MRDTFASEVYYRGLFERAMDVMVVLDLDGKVVELNPAATSMLGYAHDDVVGRDITSFVAPEELEVVAARFAGKVDGSSPVSHYRSVLVSKDGRRVPVDVSSEAILRDGEPCGVLAIARDVTEELAARAALEESERLFRSAFEGAAAGMTLTDGTGALVWANAAFAEMLGYAPSELVGMRMDTFVHPDDLSAIVAEIEKLRAGLERRCAFEKRYVRKDGGIVVGRVGISTVRADDGSILFFVGQVEDVTELRRVQADLDESQALHRLVFESSRDVLSIFGTDGAIRLISPAVKGILGSGPGRVGRAQLRELDPSRRPGQNGDCCRRGDAGRAAVAVPRSLPRHGRQLPPRGGHRLPRLRHGRQRQLPRRELARCHRPGRAGGSAPPRPEDGGGRTAGGRRRARLQQPAARDPRLRRAGAAEGRSPRRQLGRDRTRSSPPPSGLRASPRSCSPSAAAR